MHVLLDTNIYLSDPYYSKPEHEALKNYLRTANAKILIPETVDQEVKKNLTRISVDDTRTLKRLSHFKLQMITNMPRAETVADELQAKYSQFIARRSKRLTHESLNLSDLFKRSLAEKPPFKSEGRGFRDALIWGSLLYYLGQEADVQIAFISNNSSDFGKESLKPELRDELEELGYLDRVFYFNDLSTFLSVYGVSIEFLNDDFIETVLSEEIRLKSESITESDVQVQYPDKDVDWEILELEYEHYEVGNFYIYRADAEYYYLHVDIFLDFIAHLYGVKMVYSNIGNRGNWDWAEQELQESTKATTILDYEIKVSKDTHDVEILSGEVVIIPF